MMEVDATLEFPGPVYIIGAATPIPSDKVCIQDEGWVLFVEGARRGRSAHVDSVNGETVYEAGKRDPVDYVVHSTTIRCILEIGER